MTGIRTTKYFDLIQVLTVYESADFAKIKDSNPLIGCKIDQLDNGLINTNEMPAYSNNTTQHFCCNLYTNKSKYNFKSFK